MEKKIDQFTESKLMLTILVPHLINRILATGSVFNCIRNAVSNQSLVKFFSHHKMKFN